MYRNVLQYLACSTCSYAPLVLVVGDTDADEIIAGGLHCERCGHVSPIIDGILDVLEDAAVPWTPAQITNYASIAAWGYERLWRPYALRLLSGERFSLRKELSLVCELLEPDRDGLML